MLTEEQVRLIKLKVDDVILAYDNACAGGNTEWQEYQILAQDLIDYVDGLKAE